MFLERSNNDLRNDDPQVDGILYKLLTEVAEEREAHGFNHIFAPEKPKVKLAFSQEDISVQSRGSQAPHLKLIHSEEKVTVKSAVSKLVEGQNKLSRPNSEERLANRLSELSAINTQGRLDKERRDRMPNKEEEVRDYKAKLERIARDEKFANWSKRLRTLKVVGRVSVMAVLTVILSH